MTDDPAGQRGGAVRPLAGRELEPLAALGVRARAVVEGTLAGLHRNPHRGSSVEFAEYKDYAPGDDIRH
ncbi:MAG: hypothetical protein H6699_04990, partial [Myxococcales bacterium]|nr:hypothetical protein [Myxococcales bacterium]